MRTHAIALWATCVWAGCSGEMVERSPVSDPTSPSAAEAPFRRPRPFETDPLVGQTPQQPAPAATDYTCPMHSDVHEHTAGHCPKCGMTLVPEQPKGGAP
jgi:hypothetical protein